jgi:hypothetical protein
MPEPDALSDLLDARHAYGAGTREQGLPERCETEELMWALPCSR